MQKQHRLAVRADLRLAVPKHPRAFGFQPVAGFANIINLVTDVVDAAIGIAFEKLRDRRALDRKSVV